MPTRRELVISEAANQTCYSAAEIIRASANPDVQTQLKILEHVMFQEWSAYRENPVFWPADDNQIEGVVVRELLRLCQLVHWVQKAEGL